MILLSSKNFSAIKLHLISFTMQDQKRQLKIGIQGLRSSERTRFLKKLFERFGHIQKWMTLCLSSYSGMCTFEQLNGVCV